MGKKFRINSIEKAYFPHLYRARLIEELGLMSNIEVSTETLETAIKLRRKMQ